MGDKSQLNKRPLSSPEAETADVRTKMPNLARSPNKQQATMDKDGLLAQIEKMLEGQTKVINASIKSVQDTVDVKFRELEQQIVAVEKDNTELKLKNANLESRMLFLEREARRNNIVISGLKAKDAKEGKEKFETLVSKNAGINIAMHNCRLIKGNEGNRFVATCSDWDAKMVVMTCKKNLKNDDLTPIFVDNDLPKEDRDVQSRIRAYARECRREGTAVQVGFRKLKIDGVWTPYETLPDPGSDRTFRKKQPDPILERPGSSEESQRDRALP